MERELEGSAGESPEEGRGSSSASTSRTTPSSRDSDSTSALQRGGDGVAVGIPGKRSFRTREARARTASAVSSAMTDRR